MEKVIIPLIFLGLWEVSALVMNAHYFPSFSKVVQVFLSDLETGQIWVDILPSGKRFAIGTSLGVVVSIIVGTLIGRFKAVDEMLSPTINAIRAMPVVALFPVIIMMLGISETTAIFIIAFVSFIPTLTTTIDGVKRVFNQYSVLIQNAEMGFFQSAYKVLIPGAMPEIFSGI